MSDASADRIAALDGNRKGGLEGIPEERMIIRDQNLAHGGYLRSL